MASSVVASRTEADVKSIVFSEKLGSSLVAGPTALLGVPGVPKWRWERSPWTSVHPSSSKSCKKEAEL